MDNWNNICISDVATVIAGQSPQGKSYNTSGVGIPFYQGKTEFTEKFIGKPVVWTTNETKIAEEGDILISVRAPVGPVNIATQRICIGRGLAAIRAGKRIDAMFLYYYLKCIQQRIKGKDGAVFTSISKDEIANISIPIPPISKQRGIVKILDEAFAAVESVKDNVDKNFNNARSLYQSALSEVFNRHDGAWKERLLAEVALDFGRGKSKHRPRNDPSLYGGDYPFIQTGEIRGANRTVVEYTQRYNKKGLAQSKLWPKGTVCVTIAANIAESAILGFDSCFPDSVIGIVADPKKATNAFTYHVLQYFKSHIQSFSKKSTQDNINLGTFERIRFPFPPVDVQKAIATKLDAIFEESCRLESLMHEKAAMLDQLNESLLNEAFSGKL